MGSIVIIRIGNIKVVGIVGIGYIAFRYINQCVFQISFFLESVIDDFSEGIELVGRLVDDALAFQQKGGKDIIVLCESSRMVIEHLCKFLGYFQIVRHLGVGESDKMGIIIVSAKETLLNGFLHRELEGVFAFSTEELPDGCIAFIVKLPVGRSRESYSSAIMYCFQSVLYAGCTHVVGFVGNEQQLPSREGDQICKHVLSGKGGVRGNNDIGVLLMRKI